MELMADKKQGCIRFQWGRDWNVREYHNVEEAANLKKVPYAVYLENKTSLLKSMCEKDTQLALMD